MQREDLVDTDKVKVSNITLQAGEQSAWHYHSYIQESVFCLSGELLAGNDTRDDIILLPGDRIDFSPGQPHVVSNQHNQAANYLLIQQGQHDFIECAAPAISS